MGLLRGPGGEDRTWLFDVTFLTSTWSCIFGAGCCRGVLTEDFSEAVQGCCSYGAHFTGPDDIAHTQAMAERLTRTSGSTPRWASDGVIQTNGDGEVTTLLVDDACVFLNRPASTGAGLGCAFHPRPRPTDSAPRCHARGLLAAAAAPGGRDRRPRPRHVHRAQWRYCNWGEGGNDFHWWCTDDHEAFGGSRPVYRELADELRVMVGEATYDAVAAHLDQRTRRNGTEVYVPHPALRRS